MQLDAGARLRVSCAGLVAALAAAILMAFVGGGLRQSLYDVYQRVLPAPEPSHRVHVVVVDAESLREVGGWPWSRFYLARLIEQIADRGAVAIGLDMLLVEPDRLDPTLFAGLYTELPAQTAAEIRKLPSMDAILARVIGRNPVVVARAGVRPGSFDFLDQAAAPLPPEVAFRGEAPARVLTFATAVSNLPILDAAALGHGLVNGDPDPDGLVRRVPLVARAAGPLTPGFALEMVRVATGAQQVELVGDRGRLRAVRVGRRTIPATDDGQFLIRFGDWRRTQTTSAVNLLRKGAPKDLFKGQIVLVGLTSAGVAEQASTPRARAVTGVFVQAQAVDAMLRGAGLVRPGWAPAAEWGLALVLALAAWWALPRVSFVVVGAVAAAELVAAFAGSALAFQEGWLVDPITVQALATATLLTMVTMLYVEGRRLQARLRLDLDAERDHAAERQQLLINELNHRVKNTLATVQSIAAQSFRPDRSPAEAGEAFVSRLIALSTAQNLLTAERWESADLLDVARVAVAPFDDADGASFTIQGPPVRLEANHALAMAMALHELGVNASKYGALSTVGGRVRVSWKRVGGEIHFVWQEAGGPLLSPPTRRGFGTRLVQDALARELGGRVSVEYLPEGLLCEIDFPHTPPPPPA
ncbi:CHASE2 domain-containing protein [Phenylobacterium sp.]|uniref:CHASE2 domain-containing protein n=1 Tax=Phenylobacterium sp. TaxID=1871053 RepID=UPI0025DCD613|nr:CHASE2 domain-containing protein [Phenylobacterium sp.]